MHRVAAMAFTLPRSARSLHVSAQVLTLLCFEGWGAQGTALASCTSLAQTSWSADGFDENMSAVDDTFCWLTEISGNWTGTGESGGLQGAEVSEST
jgi:hypothetical protein